MAALRGGHACTTRRQIAKQFEGLTGFGRVASLLRVSRPAADTAALADRGHDSTEVHTLATFAIVDSKGNTVGSVESDLDIKLSNAVAGKPNTGGKKYITTRVTLGGFSASTSIWETGTSAAKPAAKSVGKLKLD